jgi:hypothetical protein
MSQPERGPRSMASPGAQLTRLRGIDEEIAILR